MITENLSTLKIHKLTKEQYERELAAGRIDESAIYLTPDEAQDGTNITVDSALDENSENPIQNKVVANVVNEFEAILSEQVVPNLVPSVSAADNGKVLKVTNGAWAIGEDEKGANLSVDQEVIGGSSNPVSGSAVDYFVRNMFGDTGHQLWMHGEQLKTLESAVPPAVTEADNGKLLQVVNGKWTAVSITNGNEVAY